MLISEAFQTYRKREVIAAGLSSKTLESYIYAEKLVVAYFGDTEFSSIKVEDVISFYEHLLGWQAPDTARGNIICLRSVVRLMKRCSDSALDPDDIKVPKREKRTIEYLTEPEVTEFIEVVGEKRRGYAEINRLRNVAIVEILYASGIRVSELCKLNRNSINNRQFTVVGKSKEPRICFINQRSEIALENYLKMRDDNSSAMFVANQNGRRIVPGNVRRIFQNVCARSDFEGVHPHTLRHSFATHMLEKRVDLRYIADLMGHQSLDTTKIYTHYSNPKLQQIYRIAMGDL